MEKKEYVEKLVYSRRVAFELRKLGYKIVRVEPNRVKPAFDVYFFEKTDTLEADVITIAHNLKAQKEMRANSYIPTNRAEPIGAQ